MGTLQIAIIPGTPPILSDFFVWTCSSKDSSPTNFRERENFWLKLYDLYSIFQFWPFSVYYEWFFLKYIQWKPWYKGSMSSSHHKYCTKFYSSTMSAWIRNNFIVILTCWTISKPLGATFSNEFFKLSTRFVPGQKPCADLMSGMKE